MHDRRLMLVVILNKKEVGSKFTEWPKHITLVPWFTVIDFIGVDNSLTNYFTNLNPFSFELGKEDYFGPDNDKRVVRIEDTPELLKTHKDLISLLEKVNILPDLKYCGENYKPHITTKEDLQKDLNKIVNEIYLVEDIGDGNREVVKIYNLT